MKTRVFVYGTLKRGFPLHDHLKGARFLGEAVLTGYEMYDLGWYPGIVPGEGEVYGEVFEIDWPILALLDEIEDEGQEYRRIYGKVRLLSGEELEAFYYVYLGKVAETRKIASGRWERINK